MDRAPSSKWSLLVVAVAALVATACGPSDAYEGDGAGECGNGEDDDGDGQPDCQDAGCAGAPICQKSVSQDAAAGDGSGSAPEAIGTAPDALASSDTPTAGNDATASTDADPADGPDVADSSAPADVDSAPDVGSDALAAGSDAVDTDSGAPDAAGPADVSPPAACKPGTMSDLFEKKIKPLVTKGQPTTCNQCHLSGVDLGMFVQDSPCKSMACMQEKGMVDLSAPAKSQILTWIAKAKPQSELITTDVQKAEHDAFLQWITWSAECQSWACGAIADPCGSVSPPVPVPSKPMIGGCDEAALVASFDALVYKWRDRCSHCHAPYGKDYKSSGSPGWLHADAGKGGAIYTMYNVLGLPGLPGLPVINVAKPADSLLLRKPLHKPAVGGISHGGGQKFKDKNDPSYKDFLKWIEQFAACKSKP